MGQLSPFYARAVPSPLHSNWEIPFDLVSRFLTKRSELETIVLPAISAMKEDAESHSSGLVISLWILSNRNSCILDP